MTIDQTRIFSEIKIFDYLKSDFIKNNTYLNENDSLLMLLPTQPFRVNKDIDEIIKLEKKLKRMFFHQENIAFMYLLHLSS